MKWSRHELAVLHAGELREGAVGEAALRLRMPVADFLRIAVGAIDPAEPILKNRAKAKGDLEVAARLPEMFRAPTPS